MRTWMAVLLAGVFALPVLAAGPTGLGAHCRFVGPDGAPTSVSRLSAFQMGVTGSAPTVTLEPDGAFTVTGLSPGPLFLLPDLYQDPSQASNLTCTTWRNAGEPKIQLPAPLLTVPLGSEIHYLIRSHPTVSYVFTAQGSTPQVPIYGAAEPLLAVWYWDGAGTLMLWRNEGGRLVAEQRNARTVWLKLLGTDGHPYAPQYGYFPSLSALFPNRWTGVNKSLGAAETPQTDVPFTDADGQPWLRVTTVPGTYGVESVWHQVLGSVTIPEQGGVELPVTVASSPDTTHRLVSLVVPPLDRPVTERSEEIILRWAGGETVVSSFSIIHGSNYNALLPANITSVTLYWPGQGCIQDIALPPDVLPPDVTTVTLPAWGEGTVVSGKVSNQDGSALPAQVPLSAWIISGNYNEVCPIPVGADGTFTIKGVPPGTVDFSDGLGGWVMSVPPEGITGLALVRGVATHFMFNSIVGNMSSVANWFWVPDDGVVVPLDTHGATYTPLTGPGWVTSVPSSGAFLVGQIARVESQPKGNVVVSATGAHGWGDSFPPGLVVSLPIGAVAGGRCVFSLQGVGKLSPIQFKDTSGTMWVSCAVLGKLYAFIPGLPPGDYKVRVDTSSGNVEATVTLTASGGYVELNPTGTP